jgi:hypothetical protein
MEEPMKKCGKRLSVLWSTLMLSIVATAALAFNASGTELEHSTSQTSGTELEQRTKLLEDQVKMLITSEAQRGFQERFKTSFNPAKTRLLLGLTSKDGFRLTGPRYPYRNR